MNLDRNLIEVSSFSILENNYGLSDLEQQGHCLVNKIQLLENQLQDAHIKIQALTFSKMELEKILEKEKKESENTKAQLNIFQDAMQNWEKERLHEKCSLVMQSLQLEILQKEKNSLIEELKDLEEKNVKLTLQIEDNHKRLQNQNDFANLINSSRKTFETTVEKVYSESQKLEKEFNFLKKQVTLSKHSGEQMIVLLKHHHEALNKVYEENDDLKRSIFKKAGELKSKKNIAEMSHTSTNLSDGEVEILRKKLKESEEKLLDLNRKLDSEIEEKKKLKETLNSTLSAQIKFNEMEQYFRSCINDLEKRLKENFQSNAS
ncbi:uncharacterized protein LOC135832650 [Planococcus citri]|uniref:uncharacterized protein LOC135832650 n=1 Tax=Planococcus citri TaxID=170843 RepID=UPI0031F7C9BA